MKSNAGRRCSKRTARQRTEGRRCASRINAPVRASRRCRCERPLLLEPEQLQHGDGRGSAPLHRRSHGSRRPRSDPRHARLPGGRPLRPRSAPHSGRVPLATLRNHDICGPARRFRHSLRVPSLRAGWALVSGPHRARHGPTRRVGCREFHADAGGRRSPVGHRWPRQRRHQMATSPSSRFPVDSPSRSRE